MALEPPTTVSIAARVLIAVAVIGVACVFGWSVFALAIATMQPSVTPPFISVVLLFCPLCGMLPAWPSPSKLWMTPPSKRQRLVVFIEITALVIFVVFVFSALSGNALVSETAVLGVSAYLIVVAASMAYCWRRR